MTTFFAGLLAGVMLYEFIRFVGRFRAISFLLSVILKVDSWRSLECIIKRLEQMGRPHTFALGVCLFLMVFRGEAERKGEVGKNSLYRLKVDLWS